MAEHLPVLFRAATPEGATEQAKAWARSEGLTTRTIARVVRRDDMPTWSDDADPTIAVYAWEVTLVVAALRPELTLPSIPEAPSLPLWSAVPA